jgi:tetratricopeptide (TPR) repeat protein
MGMSLNGARIGLAPNHLEANDELENITAENRVHPTVLEVRWQIYAKAKKWKGALDIASVLIQLVPEHPLGWVHRSFSLHEMKRTEEARDNLLRVADKFPQDPVMRYNLACYECFLNRSQTEEQRLTGPYSSNISGVQVLQSVLTSPRALSETLATIASCGVIRGTSWVRNKSGRPSAASAARKRPGPADFFANESPTHMTRISRPIIICHWEG